MQTKPLKRKTTMRRFELHPTNSTTGAIGEGFAAEGVEFADGTAALHWTRWGIKHNNTSFLDPHLYHLYQEIALIEAIDEHRIVWVDRNPEGTWT